MYLEILRYLDRFNDNQETIMATLADIQLAIASQTTVEQGVVALLQTLRSQLAVAIKTEDPAAVQAVLDMLNANTKTLSDAVLANTPSAIATATLVPTQPTPIAPPLPPVNATTPADNSISGQPPMNQNPADKGLAPTATAPETTAVNVPADAPQTGAVHSNTL